MDVTSNATNATHGDAPPGSGLITQWASIGLAFAVAGLVLGATGQFRNAYHAADDWFMHLPIASERFLWYAQTEGRWLTLLWSHLSRYLTPNQTFAASFGLYAVAVAAVTLTVCRGGQSGLVFLALWASPFVATIMQWSAQQAAALAVLSASAVSLYRAQTLKGQLAIGGLGQLAGFLTYPGVAPLILLQLISKASFERPRMAVRLLSFPLALAIAVTVMAAVNHATLGMFALPLSDWRNPHYAVDPPSLLANAVRLLASISGFVAAWPAEAVLFCVAIAVSLAAGGDMRRQSMRLLIGGAAIVLYESTITLTTGVSVPERARAWLWVAPVLSCAPPVGGRRGLLKVTRALVLCLFAINGLLFWTHFYSASQRALASKDALVERALTLRANSEEPALLAGERIPIAFPRYRSFGVNPRARWFIDYADAAHGLAIQPCTGRVCTDIVSHPTADIVFPLQDGRVAFRFE